MVLNFHLQPRYCAHNHISPQLRCDFESHKMLQRSPNETALELQHNLSIVLFHFFVKKKGRPAWNGGGYQILN